MAAATPYVLSTVGAPLRRTVIYALYGVSTSDTIQTSTEFQKVYNWTWLPYTGTSAASNWSATVATNTNITLSPASIVVDDGLLIVDGAGVKQS